MLYCYIYLGTTLICMYHVQKYVLKNKTKITFCIFFLIGFGKVESFLFSSKQNSGSRMLSRLGPFEENSYCLNVKKIHFNWANYYFLSFKLQHILKFSQPYELENNF